MIEVSTIRLNDVVYKVNENNHYFNRKKIKMIDADGVEWYRYDRPILSYTVDEYQLEGIVSVAVIGKVKNPDQYEDEYHFVNIVTGKQFEIDPDDSFWELAFYDRAEAEQVATQLRLIHEEDLRNE